MGKMAFPRYFLLFLLIKGSLACNGKDVNLIVDVLLEVADWKYLAHQLDINPHTIEETCRTNAASCYRRELVTTYCDSTGLAVEDVAENIAEALGQRYKRQANNLRAKFPRACPGNSAPCDGPEVTSSITQPSIEFTPLSSSSSDINDELFSTTLFVGFFMAVAVLFSILLVYAAQRLLPDPPLYFPPAANNTAQVNSDMHTSPPHDSQLHQRLPNTIPTDDSLTEPIFNSNVKAASLILIKYRLWGEIKELRALKDIVPRWKQLASRLGFGDGEIQNFNMSSFYQAEDATDAMLKEWMRRDVHCSWRKLIQKMREVELNVPAENLVIALRNMH